MRITARRSIVTLAGLLLLALSFDVSARQALDRTKTPAPGQDAGPARADVDEDHAGQRRRPHRLREARSAARLVHASRSSAAPNQFEPAEQAGLASLTAAMMSEGTKTRDGEALSNALQLLGTSVSTSVAARADRSVSCRRPASSPQTLDILADMLLNSDVPGRRARAAARAAARGADAGEGAAGRDRRPRVPARALRSGHPYGRVVTEDSIKAITRDDVVAFHKAYFQPGRALVTVVGDVDGGGGEAGRSRRRSRPGRRRRHGRRSRIPAVPERQKTDDLSRRQAGRGAVDVSRSAIPARRATRPTTSRCRS